MTNGDSVSDSVSTPVGTDESPADPATSTPGDLTISSDLPTPKRYAHHGKRRRSYTDELFRCQFVDKISRSDLVCNALLWRNRPQELREHLLEHLPIDQISKMDDDTVRAWYTDAKRIYLQGIPEDIDDDQEDEDTESEDDE